MFRCVMTTPLGSAVAPEVKMISTTVSRVGVKAGGCSGLSYVFAWEAQPAEQDQVFEGPEDSRIYVDPKSYRLLEGTQIDYDTSLISKGFVVVNPKAKATCGCGTSFSLS